MTLSGSARCVAAFAGVQHEVLQVHDRLEGPDGRPLADLLSVWRPGVALASACYLAPPELRDPGGVGLPLWWVWPSDSWSAGDRRDELLLGAALALAAVSDECQATPAQTSPRLRVVTTADQIERPDVAQDVQGILDRASQNRRRLPDLELSPVPRPGTLDRICLAAAVLLLPPGLRRAGRGEVPQMWPWPDSYWISGQSRGQELLDALTFALTALQTNDRLTMPSRPGLLVVSEEVQ